jgi:hypothetical protein
LNRQSLFKLIPLLSLARGFYGEKSAGSGRFLALPRTAALCFAPVLAIFWGPAAEIKGFPSIGLPRRPFFPGKMPAFDSFYLPFA